ncbi:Lipase [Popillia japonica]|uniref:Lipase n=1 Tax=Popillia japonica TaxID=7064 RepID=A0AAW1JGW0_POPJA
MRQNSFNTGLNSHTWLWGLRTRRICQRNSISLYWNWIRICHIKTEGIPLVYTGIGYNVIIVNWSPLSKQPCYPAAFLNTWHVGQCVAILSVSLAAYNILPEDIHVLGFSLGAHIAGFASKHMRKTMGRPYGRITGLDPALPFFANFNNDWKLGSDDANFVDVIHTNAGSFGKIEPMGHVDFYVNGGSIQPACQNLIYVPLCSHLMANFYYAESIISKKFVATQCKTVWDPFLGWCRNKSKYVLMGEHCDRSVRGIYSLNTSTTPPYGLG